MENLSDAQTALELVGHRLLPFVDRADEAYLAATTAEEDAKRIRVLSARVAELATDVEDRPMPITQNPHYIDPVVRASTWSAQGDSITDASERLAKVLELYAETLTYSPEVACHVASSLLLTGCKLMEQQACESLPPTVALHLAVHRVGHATMAALDVCDDLDSARDRDGLNRVTLLRNLGHDPELRYTAGGQAVLNLRIATNEPYVDRNGEVRERTEWHSVVLWGKRGEALGKCLAKGDRVCVEGRLQTRSWEAEDGGTRYATEVVGSNLILLGGRGGNDRE